MIRVFSKDYVYIIRQIGSSFIKSEQSLVAPPFYHKEDQYPLDVIGTLRKDKSVLFVFESRDGICDEEANLQDGLKMRVSIIENQEGTLFPGDVPHGELAIFYKEAMVYNQTYSAPEDGDFGGIFALDANFDPDNGWYDMVGEICNDIIKYLDLIVRYDYSFMEKEKRALIDVIPPEAVQYRDAIRALHPHFMYDLRPIPVRNLENEPFLVKYLDNTLLLWETPIGKKIYLEIKCLVDLTDDILEHIRATHPGIDAFQCEDGSWSVRYSFGNQVPRLDFEYELWDQVSSMANLWHQLNDSCLEPIMSAEWQEAYFINEVIMFDRKIGKLGLD